MIGLQFGASPIAVADEAVIAEVAKRANWDRSGRLSTRRTMKPTGAGRRGSRWCSCHIGGAVHPSQGIGVTHPSSGMAYDDILHRNGLAGEIPASLSKLSNLEWLSLYDNELTGALPTELTYLSSLKRLYLNDNDLSSQVPAELGKMPGLTHLFLHGNDLTGTIPPELDGRPT